MEEVAEYLKDVAGCKELDQTTEAYQEEYREMRASYIMQYAPELLGEYAKYPQLESQDAEGLPKFQKAIERRMQTAEYESIKKRRNMAWCAVFRCFFAILFCNAPRYNNGKRASASGCIVQVYFTGKECNQFICNAKP